MDVGSRHVERERSVPGPSVNCKAVEKAREVRELAAAWNLGS